jgi:hypothetical protein
MSHPATTPEGTHLDSCGCCAPPALEGTTTNRPGLPELRYRVGTHATFLRRMLARLPLQALPAGEGVRPLQALTTRAEDDPSIALLDAWATVGDVLTFYQERIANEGFLRTATERRSVLEQARAIGYELSPGVAASTYLAFIVEQPAIVPSAVVPPELRAFHGGPGTMAPTAAVVPAGTQVKSVPGPGERTQTFETSMELEARVEWNTLRPRLTQPQPLDPAAKSVWVEGIVNDLKPGAWVLFLALDAMNPGDGKPKPTPKQVVAVTPEDALGRTRLDLADTTKKALYLTLLKSSLQFAVPILQNTLLNATSVSSQVMGKSWKEKDLTGFFSIQKWKSSLVSQHVASLLKKMAPPPSAPFEVGPPEPGLFAFTMRSAPFGHNAPRWAALPVSQTKTIYENDWDKQPPSIMQDSQRKYYRQPTSMGGTGDDADFFFERVVPEVLPGGWVLLERSGERRVLQVAEVKEASLADFALSGRVTGVRVRKPDGSELPSAELPTFSDFKVRSTTLHAGSRPLALAKLRIEEDIGSGTAEAGQLTLDSLVLGLEPGRLLALTGERSDLPGVIASEVVELDEAIHSEGRTTVFFAGSLKHRYRRDTVTLSANVVRATHGESVTEVLGSGDGAVPNQRFTLRRPPLTHVSADSPSGTESTLELRVNDLLWQEVPSLYRLAPDRRAHTLRIDDEGKATAIFGDGRQGARPPTGVENVVARYRSGTGLEGEVEAGTLTLLQSKPLGIRDVSNPVPATGGADPETLGTARRNAPLTVRTLGRIVSLRDYTDFARGFAGIGKAEAAALWDGRGRLVSVTIASASGQPVAESSVLFRNLQGAIAQARAPLEPFRLTTFQPLFFNLAAKVLIDPAHRTEVVLPALEAELHEHFSFRRRCFGQSVTAADVMAVMHRVAGVTAIDLDVLHLVTDAAVPAKPASLLPARGARWEKGSIALAELLLLNPAGVELTEMQP